MARSYRSLCPIARALDRVGDRWSLLLLRDLHAGPMRFGDLRGGLPGLATNLLTTRLEKLRSDGLVTKEDGLYALTELGRRTDGVLWELARLGMAFPPDEEVRRGEHLRLAAVTLQNGLARVVPEDLTLEAELRLDEEPFAIRIDAGEVEVRYGEATAPAVTVHSAYEPLMAAAGGELRLRDFRNEHVRLEGSRQAKAGFRALMTTLMLEAFEARP
ncbi:MAG: helix-turn-helix domain-containing protein [Myxococcota bacterium]